jgi:NitT/TauT family transport system substrate-binding protein
MKNKPFFYPFMLMIMAASLGLSACQPGAAGLVTLKIAVIPVLDALPLYVAQKEGLFKAHGVAVEFIPVASGAERDQLIVSGQSDGMVNEVLSTLLFNKEKTQVQIVRYARAATADAPLFRILASGKSGITKVDDLKGVEIGISDGTVIAYLTDRMLQKKGFKAEDIKTVGVPKIPDRLALLNSGQLKAGVLPDPTSSLAVQQGAVVVVDDTVVPELSFSTLAFRKTVIDAHPEAIRGFLAAVEEATRKINSDSTHTQYVPLLSEQKLVPAPLLKSYQVPNFVTAGVPSQAQFDDVLAWAKEKGLLKGDVSYASSVNASFLP